MSSKRLRGRPRGSGINDDCFLDEVADLMHASPRLRARSAIRRVITTREGLWIAASKDAMLFRLQVKWRSRKESLLEAARQRAEANERRVTLRDVILALAELHGAYRAWTTPENKQKRATTVTEISKSATEFAETLREVYQALVRRGEEFQQLVEAARGIERTSHLQMPRIAKL
ncbi:hypothetical protein D9M68_151840 [compost metagenome]